MSTDISGESHRVSKTISSGEIKWRDAALASFVASVVFVGIHFPLGPPGMATAVPAMYGFQGPALLLGATIHIIHGIVLGLLFAVAVSVALLREYAGRISTGFVLGLIYGIVTTIVLAALLLPVWLQIVGFPEAPSVPNFGIISLIDHLIYGGILGGLYPLFDARL